jgi:hypothetical protein
MMVVDLMWWCGLLFRFEASEGMCVRDDCVASCDGGKRPVEAGEEQALYARILSSTKYTHAERVVYT